MKKHAFLIIANRNFSQLKSLIETLDDVRNDIYVLIDETSKEKRVVMHTVNARLTILPEVPIYWGDYSLINAELLLFTEAAKNHYEYYHLLSGLDLPLASQNEIHDFFDNNPHKQFICYSEMVDQRALRLRLRRHLFTKYYRYSPGVRGNILRIYRHFEQLYLKLTDVFVSKSKIKFGSNWVSLSDEFVQKLVQLDNQVDIKKKFFGGYLVDELLIPYELEKLGYENTVYYNGLTHDLESEFQGNARFINWWEGSPYTWKSKDFGRLIDAKKNGHLFSRKFDANIDLNIINKVISHLNR
ncbi:glycosyl transferase [Lactiplantibacillus plantarum]|uniref:beta-1,6-N-acetylglucosaminyltransferase n=1 Tax=Lactiplantibacillus plantarum TaxID=1590 RepID=UPI003852C2EB|nr:glycosyl transferase [Lactiplantibacillus plantarum]